MVDIGDGGGEYTIGVGGVVIIGGGDLVFCLHCSTNTNTYTNKNANINTDTNAVFQSQ